MQDTVITRSVETKTRVFISYSRKDMAFADRLEAALRPRGFEVLIDRQEIYAFEDWWKRLQALIGKADTIVFVLSPDAVASREALREVEYAASLNKRFAPIVCRRVEDSAVPEELRRLNFIFFDDPALFETSADRLAEALQTDIAWIRRHTEFGDAAHRWVAAGRPSGMFLRPPVLDQAEAWLAFRPGGAPPPTSQTEAFIAQSRKAVVDTQRLRRIAESSIFTLMMAVILGLVGWMNQAYIVDQWNWWTVSRPYAEAHVWPHVLSAAKEQSLKVGDSFKECVQDCPEMVVVPAGSFTMGGPTEIEQPQQTVTIAMPFAVSKYEVTFADWDACVAGGGCNGYEPSDQGWGRGRQPVINVNWDDAQAYVAWLARVTGKIYRLLSEAEYEYTTRAGTTTIYPWGNDIKLNGQAMANCQGCGSQWDGKQTAPVGSFPPNKFGLYDMLGNIWEWTEDCAHYTYNDAPTDGSQWLADNRGDCTQRILRGDSWLATGDLPRSALRNAFATVFRYDYVGFRVARTLPRASPVALPAPPPPLRVTPAPAPAAATQQVAEAPLSDAQERALKPKDTFQECTNCPVMMVVPAGSFIMGDNNESPQHRVTIGRQFAVGQYELTFDQWDACVAGGGCNGYEPSDQGWGRGRQPVINVNWDDAQAYVAWLAKKTGKPFRLLSESEYEYATRAGTASAYPWGNVIGKNNANCDGCGSRWDPKKRRRSAPSPPTASASTIWSAMSGSGRPTACMTTIRTRRQTDQLGRVATAGFVFCAAGPGTPIRGTSALLTTAMGTSPRPATEMSGSG